MITGRSAGARIVTAIIVILLAWLIVRDAVNRLALDTRPELAARFLPTSDGAAVTLALRRVVAAQGLVDAEANRLMAQALARAPAAGQPLAIAGLAASADGELDRATALMEAARQRTPRLALVRAWLLNEYVRTGRYADALAEAGPVMRLAPESREQIYALVANLATRPDSSEAVRAALAANPDWAEPFNQWRAANPPAAVRP